MIPTVFYVLWMLISPVNFDGSGKPTEYAGQVPFVYYTEADAIARSEELAMQNFKSQPSFKILIVNTESGESTLGKDFDWDIKRTLKDKVTVSEVEEVINP